MNNYKPLEKSRGILAFANNTKDIDYESMARKTLELASRTLGIEYQIINNQQIENWANYRLDVDTGEPVVWNNHSRWQAYNLSPWDETIVIDADYLILTDRLNLLFESRSDYLLCYNNRTLKQAVASTSIDTVWATVFFFRKTVKSKMLFDTVRRIERNYSYYRHLFNVKERNFRNDYAFSMADLIVNGHQRDSQHMMPWGIVSVDSPIKSISVNSDWIVLRDNERADILPRTDLHVMSKTWFFTKEFDDFLEQT
jgi:hypothetical protein